MHEATTDAQTEFVSAIPSGPRMDFRSPECIWGTEYHNCWSSKTLNIRIGYETNTEHSPS